MREDLSLKQAGLRNPKATWLKADTQPSRGRLSHLQPWNGRLQEANLAHVWGRGFHHRAPSLAFLEERGPGRRRVGPADPHEGLLGLRAWPATLRPHMIVTPPATARFPSIPRCWRTTTREDRALLTAAKVMVSPTVDLTPSSSSSSSRCPCRATPVPAGPGPGAACHRPRDSSIESALSPAQRVVQGPQTRLQSVNACGLSCTHPGPSYVHTALSVCIRRIAPCLGSLLLCPPLPLSLPPLKPTWASGCLGMHTPLVTNTDSLFSRLDPNRWTPMRLHRNTHLSLQSENSLSRV